ncbi:ADP-ribosylglycohydrolase family protein [Arcobacter sp. CECT 8985]|uniref:ADP-ribosylglycohydrolase family protein n=1 Tax=Arcobacter sp. CECT 8985 TaxID=1935424 RepID=UPI00100A4E1F|nr:ADP-ribosylglycohydrolase family protein [Arcobacter sp. CECT 8985]RXJ86687.1 hypothetical protein CRU93_07685 [Arcobacter sp. CECT 8985]
MFELKKVKEIVLATLITDSYCLGSHWIYDEKQLKNLNIDWNELNNACSVWHKGKIAGEFTHYGDHTYWLYEFIKQNDTFDEKEYAKYWLKKMDSYNGYIDSSSRNSIEKLKEGLVEGSSSSDFSIVGRIPSLLFVSKDKNEFFSNVEKFTKLTHNSYESLAASSFFAKLLIKVLEGEDISNAITSLKESSPKDIQKYIKSAFSSINDDTFETIRQNGPACDTKESFPSVLHLLLKYKSLKELLINNAKAGGDSSARGMVASMIFVAKNGINSLPISWSKIKVII